jgi:1-acyl-sn-glycerol-3-phosphate acyltransferase
MKPYRAPLFNRIMRPVLKAVFGTIFRGLSRFEMIGCENIPFGKPYLAAINHVSIFDPAVIMATWPEMLEAMGASNVWKKPGQGDLLRLYGVIPVHRGEYDRALMDKVFHVLRSGRPLMIAPEGTRSHAPGMQQAKPGIAFIVEETGAPILPIGITGTTDDWLKKAVRGERPVLKIRIGRPFHLPPIEGKGPARREARQNNTDLVMRHIAGLVPEEYRGMYAGSEILPQPDET